MSTIINVIYIAILLCVAWQDYKTRIIRNKFHIIIFSLAIVQMLLISEYRITDRLIGMLAVSVPMLLLTLLIPGGFRRRRHQTNGRIRLLFRYELHSMCNEPGNHSRKRLWDYHAKKQKTRQKRSVRLRTIPRNRAGDSYFLGK